jgi:hypothetical protein
MLPSAPTPLIDSQDIALLLDLVYIEQAQILSHIRTNEPYPADLLIVVDAKLRRLDELCVKLRHLDTVSA